MRSLIDGVAAIATAQIGDLVGPTSLLTTVSQVDPIRAYFSLSEQEYLVVAVTDQSGHAVEGSLWNGRWAAADAGRRLANIRDRDVSSPPIARSIRAPARSASARRSRIRRTFCGPASTAASKPTTQVSRTRCSSRSAPSPSCRGRRSCASSAPTTSSRRQRHARPRVGNRWIVSKGLEPGSTRGSRCAADAGRHRRDAAAVHRARSGTCI